MTRNPLDASRRLYAAGTRLNGAIASVDAGCSRTIRYVGRSFA
ncbi:hypothetical protein [Burkholderia sp. MSMB1072]|nr:hypothetical protein [Burkholderia sp. MSMB1072]